MLVSSRTCLSLVPLSLKEEEAERERAGKKKKTMQRLTAALQQKQAVCPGLFGQALHPQLGAPLRRHLHNETSIDFGFSIRNAGWIPFHLAAAQMAWMGKRPKPETHVGERKKGGEKKISCVASFSAKQAAVMSITDRCCLFRLYGAAWSLCFVFFTSFSEIKVTGVLSPRCTWQNQIKLFVFLRASHFTNAFCPPFRGWNSIPPVDWEETGFSTRQLLNIS